MGWYNTQVNRNIVCHPSHSVRWCYRFTRTFITWVSFSFQSPLLIKKQDSIVYFHCSFITLMVYTLAKFQATDLPLAAMTPIPGDLIAQQEYLCPIGGACTWFPGHEGCCSVDQPCVTTTGHVKCKAPCYGRPARGNFAARLGLNVLHQIKKPVFKPTFRLF